MFNHGGGGGGGGRGGSQKYSHVRAYSDSSSDDDDDDYDDGIGGGNPNDDFVQREIRQQKVRFCSCAEMMMLAVRAGAPHTARANERHPPPPNSPPSSELAAFPSVLGSSLLPDPRGHGAQRTQNERTGARNAIYPQLMMKKQDEGLEMLGQSAERLGRISMGIHEELGHQNK